MTRLQWTAVAAALEAIVAACLYVPYGVCGEFMCGTTYAAIGHPPVGADGPDWSSVLAEVADVAILLAGALVALAPGASRRQRLVLLIGVGIQVPFVVVWLVYGFGILPVRYGFYFMIVEAFLLAGALVALAPGASRRQRLVLLIGVGIQLPFVVGWLVLLVGVRIQLPFVVEWLLYGFAILPVRYGLYSKIVALLTVGAVVTARDRTGDIDMRLP